MTQRLLRRTRQRKAADLEEARQRLKSRGTIALVDLEKVRSRQINETRRTLRGVAELRQVKSTLMKMLFRELSGEMRGIEGLADHLAGMSIFIFTDLDPFKLQFLLKRNIIRLPAKAGDVAKAEIAVPAGNTGLSPGPVISELNEVGIPTRIETGSVWVTRDTVVARNGDKISPQLAAVLSRLNITPIESYLRMKAAYRDGIVLAGEVLDIDLAAVRAEAQRAAEAAFNLSLNAWYPTRQNAALLLRRGLAHADVVAAKAWYPTRRSIGLLLAMAKARGDALSSKLKRG